MDTDQGCAAILERIKAAKFTGRRHRWAPLFDWLWNRAKERCPRLQLNLTERYVSFKVDGASHRKCFTVVRIDVQEMGLRLGFEEAWISLESLRGLACVDFAAWGRSRSQRLRGVLLLSENEKIFRPIVQAYMHVCIDNEIYADQRDGYVRHN